MLNRFLVTVFVLGLCLPTEGADVTATNTLGSTLARTLQTIVESVLGFEDHDLLGDSIFVRARPRKPGGIKSTPTRQNLIDKDDAGDDATILAEAASQLAKHARTKSDDESVGYGASTSDRSPSLTPTTTYKLPQNSSFSPLTAPLGFGDDHSSGAAESTHDDRASNTTPPLPLVRHGTEQYCDTGD